MMLTFGFLLAIHAFLESSQSCEFKIYSSNTSLTIPEEWTRVDILTLNSYRSNFIEQFNAQNGSLEVIAPFYTNINSTFSFICLDEKKVLLVNDYIAILAVDFGDYNYRFCDAIDIECTFFLYSRLGFEIFAVDKLNERDIFSTLDSRYCSAQNSYALYMQGDCTLAPTVAPANQPTKRPTSNVCFGVYTNNETYPVSEGWLRLDLSTLQYYKYPFIDEYNLNEGINKIGDFKITPDFCVFTFNETVTLTLVGDIVAVENYLDSCYSANISKFIFEDFFAVYHNLDDLFQKFDQKFVDYSGYTTYALYYKEGCSPLAPTADPSNNSTNTFIGGKYEKFIIIGVSILFFLIISCLCCCIIRRKKN